MSLTRHENELIAAVMFNNINAVRLLLNSGINVNIKTDGNTPLIIASKNGNVEMTRLLLDHCNAINLNDADNNGYTALMLATMGGHIGIVRLLLERGADTNIKSRIDYTALILALLYSGIETIRLLLTYGADINVETNNGIKAINLAKTEEIKTLLQSYLEIPDVKEPCED